MGLGAIAELSDCSGPEEASFSMTAALAEAALPQQAPHPRGGGADAESCSRQLRAWADSLQNSDIAGPRHLNDQSRANYQKKKARESGTAGFQQLLQQHLPAGHPLRQQKSAT